MTEIKDDHNKLVDERRKKLLSLREEGFNYPISIEIDTTIKNLFEEKALIIQSQSKSIQLLKIYLRSMESHLEKKLVMPIRR